MNETEERKIIGKIEQNPHYSALKLVSEVYNESGKTISAETVRKIKRNNGYNSHIEKKTVY